MKKTFALLFILTLIVYTASCEKDDICVDGDTPLMVITFYNVSDTLTQKKVNSLRVVGVDKDTTVNTISDRTSLDSIGLPLRTDSTNTSFKFILNSTDNDDGSEKGNEDIITFNYDILEEFQSRACGFIANYNNLNTTLVSDDNLWIQNIIILDTLIKNQAAAHVKIYH